MKCNQLRVLGMRRRAMRIVQMKFLEIGNAKRQYEFRIMKSSIVNRNMNFDEFH